MTHAATPHIDWLNAAAAQAEHAATQAAAAVSAHETALAAMVPPPVIDANRARRSIAGHDELPGPSQPGNRGHRRRLRTDVGPGRRRHVRLCRRLGRCVDDDTVQFAAYYRGADSPGAAVIQASGTWAVTSAPELISAGHQLMSTIPEALAALSSSPLTTFDASLSSVTSLAVETEFTVRAAGRRDQPPELPQQGGGVAHRCCRSHTVLGPRHSLRVSGAGHRSGRCRYRGPGQWRRRRFPPPRGNKAAGSANWPV